MPLGNERFSESICAQLSIRRNTGKRGRSVGETKELQASLTDQQGLGF